MDRKQYEEKLATAKRLAGKLLADNGIKVKTKLAYKLIYALYYGVFEGNMPPGVVIMLIAGRAEELVEKQSDGEKS